MKLRVAKCTPMFCTTGSSRLQSPCVYRGKLYFVYRRSIGPKPTCDKPKARRPEGRRPEIASGASSTRPKCIHLGVNTCRRPYVYLPEVYSTQSTLDPNNVTRYEHATIGLFQAEGRKKYTSMIRVCDY